MAATILRRKLEDRWTLFKPPVVPIPPDEPALELDEVQSGLFSRGQETIAIQLTVAETAKINILRMMFIGRNVNDATATVRLYGWYANGPAHYIGSSTVTLGQLLILKSNDTDQPGFLYTPDMHPDVAKAFPELYMNDIVNGAFIHDTTPNWTKGTGWTIAAGVANKASSATTSDLVAATAPLKANNTYRVTFTISAYGGVGQLYPVLGATQGTARSANGTFTEDIKSDGTAFTLRATGVDVAAFTGDVDNVSAVLLDTATGDTVDQRWRVADLFTIAAGSEGLTKFEVVDHASYLQLDLTNSQYQFVGARITYDGAIPMTQLGAIYMPIAYKEDFESLRQSA